MESQELELRLYTTDPGECPFESWLDSLKDRQAKVRIQKRLDRAELGNLGNYRFVGDGVFELKIDYGPGYRIYFARIGNLILLLLCGGDKRTQDNDILEAKKFLVDYKTRENAN